MDMKIDNFQSSGYKPNNSQAGVTLTSCSHEVSIDADIVGVSQNGIRVRLKREVVLQLNTRLQITMLLPNSKIPFSIHGIFKHQEASEHELNFINHAKSSIDDFIFECIQLEETVLVTIQRK
jgi:hypothetical protein